MTDYVVDANLVVLLVVGSFDRKLIWRHKRCCEFDELDFDLLIELLGPDGQVVCTPHALAEASNLIRLIGDPAKSLLTGHFADLLRQIDEDYVASIDAAGLNSYTRLGLTDATLLSTSADRELLTTDYDLYIAALSGGRKVTNFTHLRESVSPR